MALDWLDKIGPSKGQYLIEGAAMTYTVLTAIAIFALYGQLGHPMEMLLERLAIVAVTFCLVMIYRKYPCKVTAFLRIGFQLALLSYWYPDTYEFNRLLPNLDHLFAYQGRLDTYIRTTIHWPGLIQTMESNLKFTMI